MSRTMKLKAAGLILLFLSGAVGGASLFLDILEYYHAPDILCDIVALVYFCSFCMVFSKVHLKEEAEDNYQRGYSDGFSDGQSDGLFMHRTAIEKEVLASLSGENNAEPQSASSPSRQFPSGTVNPYTGKAILTEADYKEYLLAKSEHMVSSN